MLTIKMSDRTWAEINHLKGDDDVWPACSSGHGLGWILPSSSQLEVEKFTNQSKLRCSNKTNSISSSADSFKTPRTCSHTHTHITKEILCPSVLGSKASITQYQNPSHAAPAIWDLHLFYWILSFVQLELCEKPQFFSHLFKPLTLWGESCEREVKQTANSNKPNLSGYHLCQCKIFSV